MTLINTSTNSKLFKFIPFINTAILKVFVRDGMNNILLVTGSYGYLKEIQSSVKKLQNNFFEFIRISLSFHFPRVAIYGSF